MNVLRNMINLISNLIMTEIIVSDKNVEYKLTKMTHVLQSSVTNLAPTPVE